MNPNPNTNPNTYPIEELYRLFNLTPDSATENALKVAKRKVLALHPDKAGPQYKDHFIFYFKSLKLVEEHFRIHDKIHSSQQAMNQGRETQFQYVTPEKNDHYRHSIDQLSKSGNFNDQFNEAYNKTVQKTVDYSQYQWFNQDAPTYSTKSGISVANLGQEINGVRKQQQQYQVATYRGVQQLNQAGGAYGLYDDDETVRGSTYVSSDPFSKLKFDDLRKVHKDETVFTVSEENYQSVPKYKNTEEYVAKARPADYSNIPMTRQQIEEQQRIDEYNRIRMEQIQKRERDAYNDVARYKQLNGQFMSNFLRLK